MQKFVKYYRVSTRSQGQSGLGIEAQQRDVQLYLDNYLNEEHEVIATYKEIDSSSKENRIELSKAIECCKRYKCYTDCQQGRQAISKPTLNTRLHGR